MDHITVEDLSAYLDGELERADHSRVESHLRGCEQCASDLGSLGRASSSVSRLTAEVDIPTDDLASLRQSVPPRKGGWLSRPGWIAGVAAAGLAVIVALVAINMQPRQVGQTVGSGPEVMAFTSDAQVRDALEDDPEILSAAGRWTVGDVGREADDEALIAQEEQSDARAGSSEKEVQEYSGVPQTPDCRSEVAVSQPYPMKSVMSRPAVFRGVESWLLVYVYTPERDPNARLDRFQIWIVRRSDCSTLHYSFFRPKQG